MNNLFLNRLNAIWHKSKSGMELVQVAILIAIAVVIGLIFKDKISDFINGVFRDLNNANF